MIPDNFQAIQHMVLVPSKCLFCLFVCLRHNAQIVFVKTEALHRWYTYRLGVRSINAGGTKHQIFSEINAISGMNDQRQNLNPGIHAPKIKKYIVDYCCECSKLYERSSLESPSVQSILKRSSGSIQ